MLIRFNFQPKTDHKVKDRRVFVTRVPFKYLPNI